MKYGDEKVKPFSLCRFVKEACLRKTSGASSFTSVQENMHILRCIMLNLQEAWVEAWVEAWEEVWAVGQERVA